MAIEQSKTIRKILTNKDRKPWIAREALGSIFLLRLLSCPSVPAHVPELLVWIAARKRRTKRSKRKKKHRSNSFSCFLLLSGLSTGYVAALFFITIFHPNNHLQIGTTSIVCPSTSIVSLSSFVIISIFFIS